METHPRERSLFWPIVLIGAGVIWLLANFNLIQGLSWVSLARLWPLALIAAGLDLLFGRSRPVVGALIGLLTVGLAVGLLVAGPRLGLAPAAPELKTERFTEPLGDASSAEVRLDLAEFPTAIRALTGTTDLIDAELTHAGQVRFNARGGAERVVSLDYTSLPSFIFFPDFSSQQAQWRIGLSPRVPLRLTVDAGSGSTEMDLSGLNLVELDLDVGSGSVDLSLPATEDRYEARLDAGSGSQTVRVPVGAAGTLTYDGGSGSLTLEVADTAAVRLDVRDSGSGSLRVPSDWAEVERGRNDEGAWQSPTYDDTEGAALLVVVDGFGSGSITVRQR